MSSLVPPPSRAVPLALPPSPPDPAPAAPPRLTGAALENLHPALWRAHQLGRHGERVSSSGFAALDAQLPGGGWPLHGLTELLLPHPGLGEMRLLAPIVAATLAQQRLVMLFDPPASLSSWALLRLGIDAEQLLVIYTRRLSASAGLPGAASHVEAGGDALWALEQSFKSGHVGAVLAWLPPRMRSERLRRLQLAAQAHDGPAFMLREAAAVDRASAAPLRLGLRSAGVDRLAVQVLKRRGPLLTQPVLLDLAPVVSSAIAQAADAARARREALHASRSRQPPAGRGLPVPVNAVSSSSAAETLRPSNRWPGRFPSPPGRP